MLSFLHSIRKKLCFTWLIIFNLSQSKSLRFTSLRYCQALYWVWFVFDSIVSRFPLISFNSFSLSHSFGISWLALCQNKTNCISLRSLQLTFLIIFEDVFLKLEGNFNTWIRIQQLKWIRILSISGSATLAKITIKGSVRQFIFYGECLFSCFWKNIMNPNDNIILLNPYSYSSFSVSQKVRDMPALFWHNQ